MKSVLSIFISVALSLALMFFFFENKSGYKGAAPKEETAYERISRTKELRCGYIVWPPSVIVDPTTKKLSGYNYDIMQAIADVLDIRTTWTEIQMGQQLEALKSGRIDATCNDGPYDMRLGFFTAYSKPVLFLRGDFYVRTDDTRFDQNPALMNDPSTRFVVMDGDPSSEIVPKEYPRASTLPLPQNADPAQMMMDVTSGKADILFTDPTTMSFFLKSNPGTLRRLNPEAPLHAFPINLGVLPDQTDLLRLLNMGIDLIGYSGELDRIMDKYDPEHTIILRLRTPYRS